MSVKIMTKVWESDVDHNEMLVLLAMADWADDFGGSIFPSVARLAWKSGFSVRQTQRILGQLRKAGVLTVEGVANSGQNIYRLHASNLAVKPAYEGDARCPTSLRNQTIERFAKRCHWCKGSGDGVNGPDGVAWHVDRLLPGSKGGKYALDNVVLACGVCNRKRYNNGGAILSSGAMEGAEGVPLALDGGAITEAPESSVEPSVKSSDSFEAFWKAYPRKQAKGAAKKAWKKIPALMIPLLMSALERHKRSVRWENEGGKFIPFPATWLNGERWDDEEPISRYQPTITNDGIWQGYLDSLCREWDPSKPDLKYAEDCLRRARGHVRCPEIREYLEFAYGHVAPDWEPLLKGME